MKLELKHIAPYLPYEIDIWIGDFSNQNNHIEDSKVIGLVNGDSKSKFEIIIEGDQLINEGIKLYLRPLSDLTKEITHNGETFVPRNKLDSALIYDDPIENIDSIGFRYQEISTGDSLMLINTLLSWHFDIFDLLANDLAIPKT